MNNIYHDVIDLINKGYSAYSIWKKVHDKYDNLVSSAPGQECCICTLRKRRIYLMGCSRGFHFVYPYSKYYAYCVYFDVNKLSVRISHHKIGYCPRSYYKYL